MFSHTLKASYCWNVSRFCLNTSIGLFPHQIKFNLHQRDSYSVAPDHIDAPLNGKIYNRVESNYIIVFFSFESLLCFGDGESFLRQMFVCLPDLSVCLVHVVVGAEKQPLRFWGAAVDVYPAAATRWSMITAQRLSLWDASSSGGCC